jgi:hypothetical protein
VHEWDEAIWRKNADSRFESNVAGRMLYVPPGILSSVNTQNPDRYGPDSVLINSPGVFDTFASIHMISNPTWNCFGARNSTLTRE